MTTSPVHATLLVDYQTAAANQKGGRFKRDKVLRPVTDKMVARLLDPTDALHPQLKAWCEAEMWEEGKRVDRTATRSGQLVRRADEAGQGNLGFNLDALCALGNGERVLFRDAEAGDLVAMDQLRYRNLERNQASYGRWRRVYDPLHGVLLSQGGTVGAAHAAGLLAPPTATLFDADTDDTE